MTREDAQTFVHEKITSDNLRLHMLATEVVMRALSERLDQDGDTWALAGLVHDCDLEIVDHDAARHGTIGAELLRAEGLDEAICRAVERHPGLADPKPETPLEIALRAADQVTGLITAAALIHPSKAISALKVKSLRKRMKEKRFAAGVDREAIKLCVQIGIELPVFLEISAKAMDGIADELGLDGRLAK
jgi:uncharacterized protein